MAEREGRLRRFDRIVSVPPPGVRLDDLAEDPFLRFPYGVQHKTGGDLARVEHVLASLRPGGRAVVPVHTGVLFRSGHEERVRQALIREGAIETIISLPMPTLRGARTDSAILLLSNTGRSTGRGYVRYVRATGEAISTALIERVVEAACSKTDDPAFARSVSIEELEVHGWNLAPESFFRGEVPVLLDPSTVAERLELLKRERVVAEARFARAAASTAALVRRPPD